MHTARACAPCQASPLRPRWTGSQNRVSRAQATWLRTSSTESHRASTSARRCVMHRSLPSRLKVRCAFSQIVSTRSRAGAPGRDWPPAKGHSQLSERVPQRASWRQAVQASCACRSASALGLRRGCLQPELAWEQNSRADHLDKACSGLPAARQAIAARTFAGVGDLCARLPARLDVDRDDFFSLLRAAALVLRPADPEPLGGTCTRMMHMFSCKASLHQGLCSSVLAAWCALCAKLQPERLAMGSYLCRAPPRSRTAWSPPAAPAAEQRRSAGLHGGIAVRAVWAAAGTGRPSHH